MTTTSLPMRSTVLRLPGSRLAVRVERRTLLVSLLLLGALALLGAVSISVGDFPIPLGDVAPAVFGYGDTGGSDFIVRKLRLPRTLTGVLVGAAFGVSGSIFQALARNPLASPDFIGITAGAGAAAVAAIVWFQASSGLVALVALAGSLLTAALMYVLAYKNGLQGYRLVLVGIGLQAAALAAIQYTLTRAEIYDAARATVWLTGSLNGRGWEHVRPVALALAVLLPLTVALGRSLRTLQLGDDTAKGLGVRVERTRGVLILVAVCLAAVGTASAGPVGFVALAAPQIARRVVRSPGATIVPAALVGALLMIASDLVARRLFAPTELPVGVVTGVIGGPYLLYLLARANRVGIGG